MSVQPNRAPEEPPDGLIGVKAPTRLRAMLQPDLMQICPMKALIYRGPGFKALEERPKPVLQA
ncbi:MAG TPA: hypothetical protein VJP60_03740, partial [Rhizomicrobium sp.]|nr:hypothetical protein [Rhizomicrobium sp.]